MSMNIDRNWRTDNFQVYQTRNCPLEMNIQTDSLKGRNPQNRKTVVWAGTQWAGQWAECNQHRRHSEGH